MIKKRLKQLKESFKNFEIDGYVIPKNDEFFSEYSSKDRLKIISDFDGSAGFAVILKNENYLFVDGRYSLQAKIQSGKSFRIVPYNKIRNCNLFKNKVLGIDPKLFTSSQIDNFFLKNNKVKKISTNLVDKIDKKFSQSLKPFYSLSDKVVGENYKKKLKKIVSFIKKNKADYLFVSAPENVAWLLNIRGWDNPNSPIPNCHLLIDNLSNIFLVSNKNKVTKLLNEKKIKENQIIAPDNFENFFKIFNKRKIIIDIKTCSIYYEDIFNSQLKVIKKEDPIYLFKSIKNKIEVQNMVESHIHDGVALTKFLYWIKKKNKKKITEVDAQNKLEQFRKKNKNYLFPSFKTIAGTGSNGAIIHYRAKKHNTKKIQRNDIFLCDSGGQYKYGTTDVTRTICFSNPKPKIKNIFTQVLKGHIAVVTSNLNKSKYGKLIDKDARKYLKKYNLNYDHGTGHGVGFFSNVHEGPQAISKYNKIELKEGMILSNEPGYYEKNQFGIRIENLIHVKKAKNKLFFENLTLAPIDKDLINFKLLSKNEKNYLFQYHLLVYSKLSNYLNNYEKRWLLTLI